MHKDGSITYWSVHRQQWVRRSRGVDFADLVAMPEKLRLRVQRHIARHTLKECAP
jgi:hypothetical protein